MPIEPSELNPAFLKKIEDKYGPTSPDDFFADDLNYYAKANKPEERGEGGGITHEIIKLPSFVELYNTLEKAKGFAKDLTTKKELRGDATYKAQAQQVAKTFNDFRTFFRKNYPEQYSMVKNSIREIEGMSYNTPYAFGKANISQYTKAGYKPVNQKSLRKKSKGIDYVDLYKD